MEVLDELKAKEAEKVEAEAIKKAKQLERKQKKQEKEERKREKEKQKKEGESVKLASKLKTASRKQPMRKREKVDEMFAELTISDTECTSEEDNTVCPKCGIVCKDDADGFWICCDGCDRWFDLKCTTVPSKNCVPDLYLCEDCM